MGENHRKACKNCKWRSEEFTSACVNSDSGRCTDFVDADDWCVHFEPKEKPERNVLMSLNPKWFGPIMKGEKTFEVRKRAPLRKHPFKVYLYCTKGGGDIWCAGQTHVTDDPDGAAYQMNGAVCGQFTCVRTIEHNPPWHGKAAGTCLTERELLDYMGGFYGKLCFMEIQDPILYSRPISLEYFGLKYVPQSWVYVDEPKRTHL